MIEYCESKSDQKVYHTLSKTCYCNPVDYLVCIFTALGCYFGIRNDNGTLQKDKIFINQSSRKGITSHRYCNRIWKKFDEIRDTMEEFVRPKHFNPHVTRKGATTCAYSGTTLPASLS